MPAMRRLAAILAADVVGYSRLMGDDETGSAKAVHESRDSAGPIIAAHGGRMFKTLGDGFLVEFPSVVAAVECPLSLQARTALMNEGVVDSKRLLYRMGISLGHVLVDGDDLLGEGVNIASRLEAAAAPGGVSISESAYEQVRGRCEARFTDLGEQAFKNIARPVRAYAVSPAPSGVEAASPIATIKSGAPRLSLVVLPFANVGGGPEQEYFADGVTESLTTDLSRVAGALVISRNTAFVYKNRPIDARQIGRDLNVRYVLEGSVQRSGDRMRVNVQLIEAETSAHLWADRFDKPIAELFSMQDEIVARIANEFSAQIVGVEARRAEKASNPDSLDFWFRGLDWINTTVNAQSLANARECFQQALRIDPDSANAKLGVALVEIISSQINSLDHNIEELASAEALALQVLAREPRNPMARVCTGLILLFSKRAEQSIAELQQALALDPNLAFVHAQIGFAKCVLGRPEETQAHVLDAMRLSPRDVRAYIWCDFMGIAKLLQGQDAEALAWFRRSLESNRTYPVAHFHCAAALALCGRTDEAGLEVKAGLALAPNFTVGRYRDAALSDNPTYLAQRLRILEAMRLAGAPEG
jgi:TolB-like protein/class 3 adenylate cyclase/Tfp pilus assembly protein PilF